MFRKKVRNGTMFGRKGSDPFLAVRHDGSDSARVYTTGAKLSVSFSRRQTRTRRLISADTNYIGIRRHICLCSMFILELECIVDWK